MSLVIHYPGKLRTWTDKKIRSMARLIRTSYLVASEKKMADILAGFFKKYKISSRRDRVALIRGGIRRLQHYNTCGDELGGHHYIFDDRRKVHITSTMSAEKIADALRVARDTPPPRRH